MRLVDRLYDWLSQAPAPDCDRILAAALPHAESDWSARIVQILLLRAQETSWAALIGFYDRLPPETRGQLQESTDLMQAGIALAARAPSPDARGGALLALKERPCAKLAYVLPNALRDPTPKLRALAAETLREIASAFLDRARPGADPDEDACGAYEAERRQLTLALEEALQTFDLHKRAEVLEASLWFARDLGEQLWDRLLSRRSRVGASVNESLFFWRQPPLAYFLLTALKQPTLRSIAASVLQAWKTVPEVTALLRESDLLDDPEIKRYLASVRNPAWFTEMSSELTELAPDLRALAPRWILHAGYRGDERTSLLYSWMDASDHALQNAAAEVLAGAGETDSSAPGEEAEKTEANGGPTGAGEEERGDAPHAPHPPQSQREQADEDCTMLWQACRRTDPGARAELIAVLREHADVWHSPLKSYLRSSDPRDRILALQVTSTEQLASQFRSDLEPLVSDPIDSIRQLTQMLLRAVPQPASGSTESLAEPPSRDVEPEFAASDAARHELRTILEQLATGAADPTNGVLIGKMRELLQEVYRAPDELETAGVSRKEDQ